MRRSLAVLTVTAVALGLTATAPAAWPRHVIDDSSRGADGVRLRDVDADGDKDIVTGWEEGGITRVYLNPGPENAKERWPAVTVGKTPNVEDAFLWSMRGVVSCCEGRTQTIFVHWAPKERDRYLDPSAWTTEAVPASRGRMMWMFAAPGNTRFGLFFETVVAAGKGDGAAVGFFRIPRDKPRDLAAWTWHPLADVGWVMSLRLVPMQGGCPLDILVSDRKGPTRGVFWLQNPWTNGDPADAGAWQRHEIGGKGREVMFLDYADLDGDEMYDVVVATKPRDILFCRRLTRDGLRWGERTIRMPATAGTAKAVAVGDIDGDGRRDLVFSCEGATPPRPGVMWLANTEKTFASADWPAHDISGPEGVKFDRMELVDLDGDGDLDVLTCEERAGLGVIWYENPAR
jgi:hypothetical protein